MMETLPTIIVVHDLSSKLIYMMWQKEVEEQDVHNAFDAIHRILAASEKPLFVIADIRSNPNIPVGATIGAALAGVYQNPLLREWLILGDTPQARAIEFQLRSMTGRSNVRWLPTEGKLVDYLASQHLDEGIEATST